MIIKNTSFHCWLFILSFILIFISVSGQENKDSNHAVQKVFINGKTYYIHIVSNGETVTGIAQMYNVSEREIMQLNRELVMGIHQGQALKIPVTDGQRTSFVADSFVYHKVEKSQTLYYISKRYNIDISEILDYNPEAKEGLRTGMVLRIPKEIKEQNKSEEERKREYVLHEVLEKETLFTIAKIYGVDIEDIQEINPGLIWELEVGSTIKIPKPDGYLNRNKEVFENDILFAKNNPLYNEFPCDKYEYDGKAFKIAVLLPFQGDKNYIIDTSNVKNKSEMFFKNTDKILEYYEGILLAIDSMRKQGLSLEVKVFDTKRSEKRVKEIIANKTLDDMDLIIGPAYTTNAKLVAAHAKKMQINMVSPLSQRISLLKFNPFLFQARPSLSSGIEKLTNYLAKYHDKNFVVFHPNSKNEKEIMNLFREKLTQSVSFNKGIENVLYKEVDCSDIGIQGIENALSVGLINIVFIPSVKEPFVSDIITKLNSFYEDYKIIVFGMPEWENFTNIEQDYFHNLQTHIFHYNFIDYKRMDVKRFIRKYRSLFHTEPSQLVFQGFDATFYFLNNLKNNGRYFQYCIPELNLFPKTKMLQSQYEYKRVDNAGGFENYGIYVLKFSTDYEYVKVNTTIRNTYFWENQWEEEHDEEDVDKNSDNDQKEDEDANWLNEW